MYSGTSYSSGSYSSGPLFSSGGGVTTYHVTLEAVSGATSSLTFFLPTVGDVEVQVLSDGPRNLLLKVTGSGDTAYTIQVDQLSSIQPSFPGQPKPTKLLLREVSHDVEDGEVVLLEWDYLHLAPLVGRGAEVYSPNLDGPAGNVYILSQGTGTWALYLWFIKSGEFA